MGDQRAADLIVRRNIEGAMDIKTRINKCKTMKELDALRLDLANDMKHFLENQRLFIKQKNRIRRGSV